MEQTLEDIRAAGGDATIAAANLAFPEECEKLVQAAHDAYGPVDVLINNAVETNPYSTRVNVFELEDWMRSWAVNFHANFILSKLALEDMIPRGGGSIVNIGSGAAIGPGRGPYPGPLVIEDSVAYGTVKAALERLTQGLAMEVYRHRVSVTCLSPSQVVPTPSVIEDGLLTGLDDPRGEPLDLMVKATLLLATPIPHLDKRKTSLAPATKRAKMFLDQEKRSQPRCSYYEARLTGIPVRAGEGHDGYDGAVRPDDVRGVDASSGFEVIGRAPRETAGERSGLDGQPDDHLADAAELGRRRVGVRP